MKKYSSKIIIYHKINKRKKSLIISELMQQDTGERRWQTLCDKRVTSATTLSLKQISIIIKTRKHQDKPREDHDDKTCK